MKYLIDNSNSINILMTKITSECNLPLNFLNILDYPDSVESYLYKKKDIEQFHLISRFCLNNIKLIVFCNYSF